MKPPSPAARLLLDRYKTAGALGADDKVRLGDALRERALRGDVPLFDVRPPSPVVPHVAAAHAIWTSMVGKLSVGLLALGAAVGVMYQLQERSSSNPPIATVPHSAPAVSVVPSTREEPAAVPVPATAPVVSDSAPPAPSTAPTPRSDKSLDAPATSASEPTIDEEVRLVTGAQSALRANNPKLALQLLGEHAARFPAGKLTTARQVTRMMALCQAGQPQQARREAASFLAKNPSSPFAERVRNICVSPN